MLLVASLLAPAGRALAGDDIESLTVYLENDEFAVLNTSDRWYTHGSKAIWSYRDEQPDGPFGLLASLPRLLLWRGSDEASGPTRIAGEAGQNIYTPQELFKAEFEPRDRPYGGWLYLGAIAQRLTGRWIETADVKFGVVGPASLASQAQTLGHHVLFGATAEGWDNQLRPRLGVELGYLGRYMLPPIAGYVALIPHAGATAGNLRNLAHAGFSVVFGSRLQQAQLPGSGEGIGDTLTPIIDPVGGSLMSGLYVFAGLDTAWVANNIFVDGETFGGKPTVELRHQVRQLTAGVGMILPRAWFGRGARFSYAYFNRSPEFDSPGFTPSPRQHFGALSLTVQF
jgi:lipid A 3-O-deacylase